MMLPVGAVLNGRYRIERYLSSGGFGNTYVATNEFGERVAVKEFFMRGVNQRDGNSTTVSVSNSESIGQFAKQKEKFKNEALRLRSLTSPYIVKVQSFFEENGTAYYVMEYVEGESLSQCMKRLQGLILPQSEVYKILYQILNALDEVHKRGIFHLDIKPGNIMIDRIGNVKIIDFGASKQLDATGGVTVTTQPAYTKGYAPIEQVDSEFSKIGPWTDFYALGATLYNLLTAQRPPSYSEILTQGATAFRFPNNTGTQLRDLIQWMMLPNHRYRPQSVAQIRQRLAVRSFYQAAYTTSGPQPPIPPSTEQDETMLKKNHQQGQQQGYQQQNSYQQCLGTANKHNQQQDSSIYWRSNNEKKIHNSNIRPKSQTVIGSFLLCFSIIIIICAFIALSRCSDDNPTQVTNSTSYPEDVNINEVVAKAKAEGANWSVDEWKAAFKDMLIGMKPMMDFVKDFKEKLEKGSDADKVKMLGELEAKAKEMEPFEKAMDEFSKAAEASENGKKVIDDEEWGKQVLKELGYPEDIFK